MNTSTTGDAPLAPTARGIRRYVTPTTILFVFFLFVGGLAIADYYILTSPFAAQNHNTTLILLFVLNGTVVLFFMVALGWRLVKLLTARRQGQAGSQLHLQFATLFGAFAVVPAILMGIFSVVTLNLGIERYFDKRIEIALDNAQKVAEAYADSHKTNAVYETKVIIRALEVTALRSIDDPTLMDPGRLSVHFRELATEANFTAAYLMDANGEVQVYAERIERPSLPTAEDLANIPDKNIIVRTVEDVGQVQVIAKVPVFDDIYFLGVRSVNPEVLNSAHYTREIVENYRNLGQSSFKTKEIYLGGYLGFAAFMVMFAMWLGFSYAQRMIDPIGNLVGVAERISNGDLSARVNVSERDGELATLGRSFNRMTGQLQAQRNDLIEANRQYDERRRFTEAVLSGVSAGVVGLDREGRVTIANRSAYDRLETTPDELIGKVFTNVVPEMFDLINAALITGRSKRMTSQVQIDVVRGEHTHNFNVQVSNEGADGETQGLVVTFDDITELVNAQRTSAWADVARRIAHEIKNPLTPIQLSAERLRRKYKKEITSDPEVFDQCTETIIRQVGDIGRMVDEFSSFARMPTAVLKSNDLSELIHQSVFMQEVANPQITYDCDISREPKIMQCDGRLISQAVTNILKNAGEAISARAEQEHDYKGKIAVHLIEEGGRLQINFIDNGCGLPKEHRHRLTEPYMTTREKGTGLGLAIVKKIMEEHKGDLLISDAEPDSDTGRRGAKISMVFYEPELAEGTERKDELSNDDKEASGEAAVTGV